MRENRRVEVVSLDEVESVRLNSVRANYLAGTYDVHSVLNSYRKWVETTEYLLLKRETVSGLVFKAFKASKRGNDVYHFRVNKQLD